MLLVAEDSRGRGDTMSLCFGVSFAVGDEEGFVRIGVVFVRVCVFDSCWGACEDDEEFALAVDVGLIDRLRVANVDVRTCCPEGTAGRGIKPKRVCIVVGGGGRLVIDIVGLMEPKQKKMSR